MALEAIDKLIAEKQQDLADFSDPQWVADTLAAKEAQGRLVRHMNEHPELYPPDNDLLD